MHTMPHDEAENETPTRAAPYTPIGAIVLAARVAKLCEIATEQPAHDDGPHVASAIATVAQIRALALEVLR